MIAYDYPLLGLFWSMLIFFLWFAWLMLLFRVFGDIFRSSDLGGVSKALWTLVVLVLPFLGTFIYLVVRGNAMTERDIQQSREREDAFQSYVRTTAAGGSSSADELVKLADLNARGVLSDAEFAQQKAKLLA